MGSILVHPGTECRLSKPGNLSRPLLPRLAVKRPESLHARRVDVSLTLKDLPFTLAEEIEEVQRSRPDLMERIVMYGMTRSAIFETLLEELSPAAPR